jgi:uncharacterized protein (DUF433 family)
MENRVRRLADDDFRLMPVLTVPDAAFYLDVPKSTLYSWISGRHHLVTYHRQFGRRRPSVPFIGLAEAYAITAFKQKGVRMQRIWPALERLRDKMGIEHALASRRLHTDGAEILWEMSERDDYLAPIRDLVVVRNEQVVFVDAVRDYLECIAYDNEDWATSLRLRRFGEVPVVVDPHRAFGRPLIEDRGGVRVEDVLDLWDAGERPRAIAHGLGLSTRVVQSVIGSAGRLAA